MTLQDCQHHLSHCHPWEDPVSPGPHYCEVTPSFTPWLGSDSPSPGAVAGNPALPPLGGDGAEVRSVKRTHFGECSTSLPGGGKSVGSPHPGQWRGAAGIRKGFLPSVPMSVQAHTRVHTHPHCSRTPLLQAGTGRTRGLAHAPTSPLPTPTPQGHSTHSWTRVARPQLSHYGESLPSESKAWLHH